MSYCETDVCLNFALNDSTVCNACLHARFEDDSITPLPLCLMQETFGYCCNVWEWFTNAKNVNFADFYFVYRCSKVAMSDCVQIFQATVRLDWDSKILEFLAIRYLNARTFWNAVGVEFALTKLLRLGLTSIVENLPPSLLQTIPNPTWIRLVHDDNKTDCNFWWLLEFRPNITQSFGYWQLWSFLRTCCRTWKSERVILRIFEDDTLISEGNIFFAFDAIVEFKFSFIIFKQLWELQTEIQKQDQGNQQKLFICAIVVKNYEALDFLSTLNGFSCNWVCSHFIKHCDDAVFRMWMTNNNFITADCLQLTNFYKLKDDVMLEMIATLMIKMDITTQIKTLQNSPLFEELAKTKNQCLMDQLFTRYQLQSFGSQKQCSELMIHMCRNWDFLEVKKYADCGLLNPCIDAHYLCLWLAAACNSNNDKTICWLLQTYTSNTQPGTPPYYPVCLKESEMLAVYFLQLIEKDEFILAQQLFRCALTFKVLRAHTRTFLLYRTFEQLLWFSILEDFYGERIRIRDVRASHNMLLRTAQRSKNILLKEWLWNFVDAYGCTLKSGDIRDLRRG